MNGKKRVLIACGTAIATATVVAGKVREIGKEIGIPIDVVQCKASEVRGKLDTFNPHVIVATTPLREKLGVPVFNGVPFLSGVGADELKDNIIEELKKA